MLTYPFIDPVLISVGPVRVHWYGLMYVAAFFAALLMARHRASQPGSTWSAREVDDLIFYGTLGAILGGRIGYVLFYGLSYWRQDWLYPLKVWDGGMSFHGGLLGVVTACALYAVHSQRNLWDICDFSAPFVGPGIFFVRMGNFINGELWGKPTTVPWAVVYQGVPRHPSQVYEALLEGLLLGAIVFWFTARRRSRCAPSGLFLLGYGVARFCIEFVRVSDANRGYLLLGWVTEGQILSVPMILGGILMLIVACRRHTPSGNFAALQPALTS